MLISGCDHAAQLHILECAGEGTAAGHAQLIFGCFVFWHCIAVLEQGIRNLAAGKLMSRAQALSWVTASIRRNTALQYNLHPHSLLDCT